MIRILTASAILATTLLAGCASTSRLMISPARPAIAPEQVRVYMEPPQVRYVEIALLETSSGPLTYGEQNKSDAVVSKLRNEAARLGANGIVLQGMGSAHGGNRVNVGVGGGRYSGGHTRIGAGVGVDISPTPKHARALAIFVEATGAAPATQD